MKNKKATGMHWYIWYFAVIGAVAYVLYTTTIGLDIALGEVPAVVIKSAEEISTVPQRMEGIMEVIHEESVTVLQDYEAYLNGFNSYCSDTYRASLGSRRYDSNNYGETYGWTYCRVYGDIGIYPHRLGAKFGEFFSDNYDEASSNVDLLSGSYTSFVPRDPILVDDAERFRDQVVSFSAMPFPIEMENGTEIGNFLLDPSFQFLFPDGYTFVGKEWCIWATVPPCTYCQDVGARYLENPPNIDFIIMDEPCGYYIDCFNHPNDDEGICLDKFFKPAYLCTGTCTQRDCEGDDSVEYLLDSGRPTHCLPDSCNRYGSCFGTTSCNCDISGGNTCEGDCTTCDTDADPNTQCLDVDCVDQGCSTTIDCKCIGSNSCDCS